MVHPSARRPPPADLHHAQLRHHHHQATGSQSHSSTPIQAYRQQQSALKNAHLISSAPPASSKTARPDLAVKAHFRGHQRRHSVARLLPDISKLRLLSWLVEASNELINCDIAIMDGVYAKLNRSRESLLFWQQSQQQLNATPSSTTTTTTTTSPAAPPRPPPPSVQPVANKSAISQHQQRQLLTNNNKKQQPATTTTKSSKHNSNSNNLARNKSSSQKGGQGGGGSEGRNHHSLPLTNYDASSLAAISIRSNKTIPMTATAAACTSGGGAHDNDSMAGSICSQPSTPQSAAATSINASMAMMKQNLRQQQQQQQQQQQLVASRVSQPTILGARNNRSLPNGLLCEHEQQANNRHSTTTTSTTTPATEPDYCDSNQSDDDDNSSAASSTTSSGIHGTSSSSTSSASSSSAASSSSSSTSSAASTSSSSEIDSSFDGLASAVPVDQHHPHHQATKTAASSAEQLSERIRRAVIEHNYLQNLLVNVIRQHDRQRALLDQQARHQMALMRQQQRGSDLFGQPPPASSSCPEMPRIDLADIADALDDGCQCSCHSQLSQLARHHRLTEDVDSSPVVAATQTTTTNKSRASTLPSSSSLSLFQAQSLVPSRKNRHKKHSEPSREDILQKLSGRLCEGCFETHYWLLSCTSIELTPPKHSPPPRPTSRAPPPQAATPTSTASAPSQQQHQTTTPAPAGPDLKGSSTNSSNNNNNNVDLQAEPSTQNPSSSSTANNNDAIVSLRNATFIKLVQQQVRSTISNSIELIDLIRKEIKSPESIKQKQLMRCFSASIQLLSSVASYVVPSQDISTFIPTEMVSGGLSGVGGGGLRFSSTDSQQATTLFNLPPSDFDHLLLYSPTMPGLNNAPFPHHHPLYAASATNQHLQPTTTNYHLAQAPEIPMRRRHPHQLQRQRRASGEPCSKLKQKSADSESFRSLPPNVSSSLPKNVINELFESDQSKSLGNSSPLAASQEVAPNTTTTTTNAAVGVESSSGASSNNSSASSSIARGQVQQSSLTKAHTTSAILDRKTSHDLSFEAIANLSQHNRHHQQAEDDLTGFQSGRAKFWQSSKFNFIKKLLQVKQQRLLRQQSKDRRIYNNKVQNKFRLVMMDLTHFNRSQQLLTTENGVNSLLTSMRNVLEFGLYLTVKLY